MRISTIHLTKRYGAHAALADVSFETGDAVSTLVLLGPSGGGKSTLLRVLGSLLVPDAGNVLLDGAALSFDEPKMLLQRRANGFVFQAFNLFPHLTALENVAMPLRVVHGRPESEARDIALAALTQFGMASHAQKKPAALSGGQQQRVALARALAPKPRLLLLDEPTSALDPVMTQEVLALIRELARGGQKIILSTHEIGFARQVADWVVFLDQGCVAESSAASDFFVRPVNEVAKKFLDLLSAKL